MSQDCLLHLIAFTKSIMDFRSLNNAALCTVDTMWRYRVEMLSFFRSLKFVFRTKIAFCKA